jgi:hypothetical protein
VESLGSGFEWGLGWVLRSALMPCYGLKEKKKVICSRLLIESAQFVVFNGGEEWWLAMLMVV